jgi:hypothetical protein
MRLSLPGRSVLPAALATAAILSSCGAVAQGSGHPEAASEAKAVVVGQVLAGPACPVQRTDTPCPPRPVKNAKVQLRVAGHVVSTGRTDARGSFRVLAPVGTVVVRATNVGLYPSRAVETVHLARGETAHVSLVLDSGIR